MENDMTDEDMIGYVLDLLEPAERRSVEHYIAAHPEAAAAVERLRTRLAPLAADRDLPEPPEGLSVRTVTRLAEYLVEHEPEFLQKTPPEPKPRATDYGLEAVEPSTLVEDRKPFRRSLPGWLKPDLIVTACIGVVVVGLAVVGVGRYREHYRVVACEHNLSTLHKSLVSYCDTHDGHYPQIDEEKYPTAGHFAAALAKESGDPTKAGFTWHDPGDDTPDPRLVDAVHSGWNDDVPGKVQYTYALGYRGQDGKLHGLRRGGVGGSSDLQPVAADLPHSSNSPGDEMFSPHRRGHNVLYVGGNVRFGSSPNMGIGGDHIYQNRDGHAKAGIHPDDSTLGRPTDRP